MRAGVQETDAQAAKVSVDKEPLRASPLWDASVDARPPLYRGRPPPIVALGMELAAAAAV